MKRLIFTGMDWKGHPCHVTAIEENQHLLELRVSSPKKESLLGSIHVGKVQKVLPNIQGAFIEIENRLPCFYHLAKNQKPIYVRNHKTSGELKPGDELLVQVTQEALKTKAPCVSSNLSFPGNYLVVTTENHLIGVSGKISRERREELKQLVDAAVDAHRDFGVIVRTNAQEADNVTILAELQELIRKMRDTLHRGSYSPCFTRITARTNEIDSILKNLYWDDMEKIVTDQEDIYRQAVAYRDSLVPKPACEIALYQDSLLPLYKLYRLEHGLEQALSEKVWLRSGGFLVIQQTEAFVAIDVNSGKNMSKKLAQKEYKKVNEEAAKEIARQLRLRNLYGMILIDFINMKLEEDRAELLHLMRQLVKNDRITTTAVDVTALGIMELTRKKEEKSLREQVLELTGGENH
ncbi:MAG: ribonuclease E/G [Eubacterium sp.]|nr:ribonuclease E/G [Eubacterium sp.]